MSAIKISSVGKNGAECLCAPKHSYAEILLPDLMLLGSGAFGR